MGRTRLGGLKPVVIRLFLFRNSSIFHSRSFGPFLAFYFRISSPYFPDFLVPVILSAPKKYSQILCPKGTIRGPCRLTSAEGEVGFGACPICEDGNGVGRYSPRNFRPQQATKNGLRQTDEDRCKRHLRKSVQPKPSSTCRACPKTNLGEAPERGC